MKHIKTYEFFEKIKKFLNKPKIGDYVICEDNNNYNNENAKQMASIINNNIGKIIDYKKKSKMFYVEYKNIPHNLKGVWFLKNKKDDGFHYIFSLENIKHFSENEKDLELILIANKYNL